MVTRFNTSIGRWLAAGVVGIALALPLACRSTETSGTPAQTSSSIVAEPGPGAGGAPVAKPSPDARIEDERNTIDVFRAVTDSVVFVTQRRRVVDYWGGAKEVQAGSGSGFVWDDAGHVVTNFHVIKDAERVTVTLSDDKTYEAKVVGVEPRKDVAVLKIDAKAKLTPISVSDKLDVVVGQKAIAIGNPFGLDHTLTVGVVSALGREVDGIGGVSIRDMIQTDAAINPGNSGGPLLDSQGQLIGMNTVIYSKSGSSAGIGFAVPADTIKRVADQLINTGKVEQVGMGIGIDPSRRIERRLGISGVVILHVGEGSPAAKAGLRGVERTPGGLSLGDVLVGIDGEAIADYDDLYNTLDRKKAGDKVKVDVIRGDEKRSVDVELVQLEP